MLKTWFNVLMNLFTRSADRKTYLFWNVVAFAVFLGFAHVIDLTKSSHVGLYWLPARVIVTAIFIVLVFLSLYRRLQNAGWTPWLVLLYLVPIAGFIFGIVMLFI